MRSKIRTYAAIGLLLSPLVAAAVKGQSLEDRMDKALAGKSVRVTVQDDFNKLPLADAWVRFTNQNDSSIAYSDSTDSSGVVQWNNVYTAVSDGKPDIPKGFRLNQNYPNPFNPSTTIPLSIDRYCDVNLSIYNIKGQLVKTMYDGNLNPGEHEYRWDGTDNDGMGVAAGQYFTVFRNKNELKTIKMMLIDGHSGAGGGSSHPLAKTAMNPGQWYDVNVDMSNYQSFDGVELVEEGSGIQDIIVNMTRNNQAPVPNIAITPLHPVQGDTVKYDASGSTDADGDTIKYHWDVNGTSFDTSIVNVVYTEPGTKSAALTLNDGRAQTDTTVYVDIALKPNLPPVAKAEVSPKQAKVGQPVNFTDLGSFDTDGSIVKYHWDAGDGTEYNTPNATHPYSTPGNKTVTFTVTDNGNASKDTTFTVSVSELEKIAHGLVKGLADSSNVNGAVVQIGDKADTTNADGSYSIAGLQPGTYRMRVTTPGFLTHERSVAVADSDTTNITIDWLFPSDTTSVNWRNGTVMQDHGNGGGYSLKWKGVKPTHYVDTKTIPQNVQDMIVKCATDPILSKSTNGFLTYAPNEIRFVTTSERPAYGTEGTIVFDKHTAGNRFAFWEYDNEKGRIKAVVVNLSSTADMPTVATETWGAYTGTGDFNRYRSVFNGIPIDTTATAGDQLVVKYQYAREANTTWGADSLQDIEPHTQGLGKAAVQEQGTRFYVNGKQRTLEELLPQQRKDFEDFLKECVSPPTVYAIHQ